MATSGEQAGPPRPALTGDPVATSGGRAGPSRDGVDLAFWVILAALTIYVAACARFRDNYDWTDDWEHHRAVRVLAKDLWKPGNPTYATDEPSIRYSPYSLALALIVRSGACNAYVAMSWAGVVNTVLLGLCLRSFLGAYGRRDLAAVALAVTVVLWGGHPKFANSYALDDLPTQQVNPSALVWALTLFLWGWFRRLADRGIRAPDLAGIVAVASLAMLSHAMTGAAAIMGLGLVALAGPPERRARMIAAVVAIGLAVLAICAAWPWFDFIGALKGSEDSRDYWFNAYHLYMMLAYWSVPAIVLAAFALPLRGSELVRLGYLGAGVFYALSFSSYVTKSPLTARLPMIGIFFLQLNVAAYLADSGASRPRNWPGLVRDLLRRDYGPAARPILDVAVGLVLAYCLGMQLLRIVGDPGLGRPYIARALKLKDKQEPLKPQYDRLLVGVGERDVVLADPETAWPVPSTTGRIVLASHYEFFTKGQKTRLKDVDTFFGWDTPEAERLAILKRYDVRWILLSRKKLSPFVFAALLRPEAVVQSDKDLTLMDAKLWELAGHPKP